MQRCLGWILVVMSTASACGDDRDKIVFTTTSSYKGDLGGLPGADAKCADAARAAGLGGTFIALLSDSTTDAIERVTTGPWQLPDGNLVFADAAALASVPLVALHLNESGGSVAGCAWTGSKLGGKSGPELCMDWSVGMSGTVGRTGNTAATDERWIEGLNECGVQSCGLAHHLYCIEP